MNEIEMEESAFMEEDTPQENDYIITSEPLATYQVIVRTFSEGSFSRNIGEFKEYDQAYKAIKEDMEEQKYWPNVFYADEHNCFIDKGFTDYQQQNQNR